jgi:hypothetical protein
VNRDELVKLAAVGMRQRLQDMERYLAQLFREFPQLFMGETPPQFVRPELKNGKGHEWPIMVSETERTVNARKARWTPERRQAQAERMRKRRGKLHPSKMKHTGLVMKVHRYLAKHGESALRDIIKGTGGAKSSSIISSMNTGFKTGRFVKSGPARYALGPNAQQEAE